MSDDPHHANRWRILFVIGLAQLMVVLDGTIVNIALPSAQRDLGFGDDQRQWIVTAYALAFGSLLLLGGRLGDLFGRKYTFIGGLIGFSAASAAGGLAPSFGVLVGARAAQGVFGAVLAPSALALLATTFTNPSERGKAFGIYGAIAGGGAGVGLLLGGVLTEWLSWRWCLWVNLALALPAALVASRLLVNRGNPDRPPLDLVGTAFATTGLFALVYGFSNSESHSWGHPLTIVSLAASAVLLTTFIAVQRRVAHPLLPLRIVLDRTRGGAYLAIGISGCAMFAVFLFLTYYLQAQKGFTPIQTGFGFLPMVVGIVFASTTANIILIGRVGPKPLMVMGMSLATIAMVWFAQLTPTSGYAGHVLPALVLMGYGMGNIFAPGFQSATFGVDRSDTGVASALVNTNQQVGGSVGTALLSSIFASSVTAYAEGRPRGAATLTAATVHGYTVAFWVAAGIFAFGAVVVGSIMRSVRLGAPGDAPAGDAPAGEPAPAH